MNKNDIFEMLIEDMGIGGEGIGKVNGFPLFVKDALIGDRILVKVIKLKKTYGYGRLMEILEPSPKRCEPRCQVHRQCGGCQIQALKYEEQLIFKQRMVENNLRRIGGFDELPMKPILGMENPYHYRNKAQYPVGRGRDGQPVAGFYAGRTHDIIPHTDCELGVRENREVLEAVLAFMREQNIPAYDEKAGTGIVRHVLIRKGFFTGQMMACVVINGDKLPKQQALIDKLTAIEGMTSISISPNKRNTNVILGDHAETIWGEDTIEDKIGDIRYQISPMSFFQVNPVQTKVLYGKALEYAGLTGEETVWDLYCGIGTISLFLAQRAKRVYGVEIIPEAIADARRNAELNGITNAEFFVGKAEEVLPEQIKRHPESAKADVIVVDPPRKGCDAALLQTILDMSPRRVVYVSCDSATLARDLRILCDGGYELAEVQPVDQFCHTVHVETVCLLSKKP